MGLLESLVTPALIVLILTTLVSGFMVFGNESEDAGSKFDLKELLGGFAVFYTGERLNERGRKWRPYFVASVVLLAIVSAVG